MIEMKPVAWSYYKRYGFKWTLEFTETPLEKGLLRVAQITPLYTAAQLAEAVAAERERCAKVCEAHSNSALCSAMIGGPDAQGLQSISYAHQRAAQSIRSAMK